MCDAVDAYGTVWWWVGFPATGAEVGEAAGFADELLAEGFLEFISQGRVSGVVDIITLHAPQNATPQADGKPQFRQANEMCPRLAHDSMK